MDAFYRSFSSAGQRKFGFFGRTNEERGMDLSAAVMAKKSIWPFWQAILDKYYVTSVRDVLQSNEDGETGEDRLRYELRSAITSKFSYHQLMSESVREESLRLRKFTIQDVDKVLPRVRPVSTPEEYFAQEAIRDMKVNIYLKFYRVLSEELEKLYLRYCYELGYLPKYRQNPTRLHIVLKEDLLKCDQYSEQAKLLSKYHVNTDEDLSLLMERIDMKMQELSSQRDERRLIAKRVLPVAETDKAREEAKELTREIRELRHEAKVCREVQDRSGHVRENLEIVDRDRQKEKER